MKSGSSVVAVSWSSVPQFLPDVNPVSNKITGEATVVNLGNGKYLFALLKGTSTLAQRTVVSRSAGPAANAWFYHASIVRSHLGKPAIIKSNQIPMLVTFADINDPKTVKRVDPNDIVASFGCGSSVSRAIPAAPGPATARLDQPDASSASELSPEASEERAAQRPSGADVQASGVSENKPTPSVAGQAERSDVPARERTLARAGERKRDKCYSLKSITLEITDKPVTKGVVEKVINWLSQYPEPSLVKGKGESDRSKIPFGFFIKHGDLIRR